MAKRTTAGLARSDWTAILLLFVVVNHLSCAERRGVESNPKESVVYVAGATGDHIYVFDADNLEMVDSIPFQATPAVMAANPDGSLLYVFSYEWDDGQVGMHIIDTKTKSLVLQTDEPAGLPMFARDGQILLKARYFNDTRVTREYLCDPLTLLAFDSLPDGMLVRDCWNGTDTLLIEILGTSTLHVYDLATKSAHGSYQSSIEPYDSTAHSHIWRAKFGRTAESAILVTDYSVELGNLNTGETLLSARNSSGDGEIAVTPAREYAAVSVPGSNLYMRPARLDVLDLVNQRVTIRVGWSEPGDKLATGGFCGFLPDSHKIIVSSMPGFDWGPMLVYNMDTQRVESWYWLPTDDGGATCFAIAPAP